MITSELRLEVLKLAVHVELSMFENKHDGRSLDDLRGDILDTAERFRNAIAEVKAP